MIFTSVTLIASGASLLSSLLTPFLNTFYRRPRKEDVTDLPSETPITLIITSHGNARQLDEHLPLYLTQDYPAGYEVIVVGEKNDSETEDILKRYSGHPHLYTTFIPETSRYMSHKKLAITLGMKAARNEWVVITDPSCKPNTKHWLRSMSVFFTPSTNLVLGYTNYGLSAPDYYRFEHLYTALYIFREALKRKAYRTNCYNLAIRKSVFLDGNGFQGNLKYTISEYDYLVNKFSDRNTALCLDEEGWLTEDTPTVKQWQNKHIYLKETVSHLRRTRHHFLRYRIDQFAMYVNYALVAGLAIYGVISHQWAACAIAAISLVVTLSLRVMIGKRALRAYHQPISSWKIIPYELSMIWRNARNRIRYENADKYDFISHKV